MIIILTQSKVEEVLAEIKDPTDRLKVENLLNSLIDKDINDIDQLMSSIKNTEDVKVVLDIILNTTKELGLHVLAGWVLHKLL